MSIDFLFKVNLRLYNILVRIKNFPKIIKNRKALKEAKKIKEVKDRPRTDVVYICGNGPSLNKVNLKDINDDYIVVNDFCRFEKKNPDNPPKYYLLLDDYFLSEAGKDRFKSIMSIDFDTTFVMNGVYHSRVSKDYPDIKAYYFCPWKNLFSHKKKIDFAKNTYITWNVISQAIVLAIYLGYKEIRLLGCDFSVFAQNAHFYSNVQSHASLRKMLFKYCFTTEVHYEIEKYAKEHGIKIINMTKETLLDAYEIDKDSQY